jgi:hypothetical protein
MDVYTYNSILELVAEEVELHQVRPHIKKSKLIFGQF